MRHPFVLLAGIALAVLAVSPPVHAAAHELFAAHMVQHLILVLACAPLIAWGYRLPLKGVFARPLVVGALHAGVLWAWHLPVLYDRALGFDPLHGLEHLLFLGTAAGFWALVLDARSDHFSRVALVFVTALQSSALGVVIAFAATPLYESHLGSAPLRGLTPLEDQQLAGAIMWVPAGVVYLVVMMMLLWRAFRSYERLQQATEKP